MYRWEALDRNIQNVSFLGQFATKKPSAPRPKERSICKEEVTGPSFPPSGQLGVARAGWGTPPSRARSKRAGQGHTQLQKHNEVLRREHTRNGGLKVHGSHTRA